MQRLKIKLKDDEADDITIENIRDIHIDFYLGTVMFNHGDESGPLRGEYALADLEDIDWETMEGTRDVERTLTTYQHRAMRNLPPVLPGQPDQTYEPTLPKILKPTPGKVPDDLARTEMSVKEGEKVA
jgi:hypothetical protein